MKTRSSALFLALFALLAALVPTLAIAGDTHIFILSGQSNMAGLKPESTFLPELKKQMPGADIRHIKVAQGGKPIRMWVAEWDAIAEANGLDAMNTAPLYYPQILKEYEKAIAGAKPKSVTFLWMQGEKDAKTGLSAAYKASLKRLIEDLRADLDAPEMNVVIGRISDHAPGDAYEEYWDAIREIHVAVAAEDPRGAWVDTDDLNDKIKNGKPDNDLHYTKEGYDLFGQRLARQAVRLVQGEKPADDGRPE